MLLSKSLLFFLFCFPFFSSIHSQNLSSTNEQILTNGRIWRYNYKNIKGYPFLFSNKYLDGSVTIDGITFNSLKIRYDIFVDEIIMPLDTIVLQLNKEHIDSFSFIWGNRNFNFIRIAAETQWPFNGYVQNVYSGENKFFIKYQKKVDKPGLLGVPDNFYQTRQLYFILNGETFAVNKRRDVLRLMDKEEFRIKNFIHENRVRLRMSHPESFIPVLRFYDQITRQEE
jgi:hypothetical protein